MESAKQGGKGCLLTWRFAQEGAISNGPPTILSTSLPNGVWSIFDVCLCSSLTLCADWVCHTKLCQYAFRQSAAQLVQNEC
eukprot:3305005-Amphidinium_carterae.1